MPTYHLAVVVDDHLMEITHILRGEEWISSAPLHKLLYDAFGWEMPQLVHMSVILDPSGKGKMSKRKKIVDGKEYLALVREFIDAGYLPEAMFNFLANVGWNYDPEQEVFTREQAIERFELADLTPAPAALPYAKLEWLNGVYIREMDPAELQTATGPLPGRATGPGRADAAGKRAAGAPHSADPGAHQGAHGSRREDRLGLRGCRCQITYPDPSLLIGKKLDAAQSVEVLREGRDILIAVPEFTAAALEAAFREAAADMEINVGSFFGPFRVAITGKTVSPPLFESMESPGQGRDRRTRQQRPGRPARGRKTVTRYPPVL